MKKVIYTLLFLGFFSMAMAQSTPQAGDELIVKAPKQQNYLYVDFPHRNILTKRTKVANYKSVENMVVIVDEVMTDTDGNTMVTLKAKDGSKFFGLKSAVKANYTKALEVGELASNN